MQDLITALNKVFNHKDTGAYIDIGAYDGKTGNVTNFFYQYGWRGVCIEPQTKYFKLGQEARPEDTWIKGVVVSKAYEGARIAFYEDPTGRYASTIDLSGENTKKQLKAIRINDDVPREFADSLDVLVIDTGEDDVKILNSIDLGLWKPHIVAMPSDDHTYEDDLIRYMQIMGYFHFMPGKTGNWIVFSNDKEDQRAL